MDSEKYIKKWLEGTLNEEERKLFEASAEFESLKRLTNSVMAFQAPAFDTEAELKALNNRKAGMGKSISMSWIKPALQIAAILVIAIGTFFYFYLNSSTTTQTVASQKSEIYLPDSSKVILNSSSFISFREKIWQYNREVTLDGEAFFDVAQGSRFDVETSSGIISVLGTEFNVKNRDNYFEVVCFEGAVSVEREEEITRLPAGNSLRIIDGILEKSASLGRKTPGWLYNESEFRSVPFLHVIREFERQYNVIVHADDVDLVQLFTGKFVHDDQVLALQSISIPFNLKYQINGNQVILSGNSD